MKKIYACFILLLGICSMLVSQDFMKVGLEYFSVIPSSGEIKINPANFLDTKGYYILQNNINNYVGGYLLQDSFKFDYKVCIYNHFLGKIEKEYAIEKGLIENHIEIVYFTENFFYTLETENDEVFLFKRKHNGEICTKQKLRINYGEFFRPMRFGEMIVDEDDGVVLLSQYLSTEDVKHVERIVAIYSLESEKIIFEDLGKFLFTISNDRHELYYSKGQKVNCINYSNGLTKRTIQTFLKGKKEKIVELVESHDDYILVTDKERFDLFFSEIVFGYPASDNYYYHCTMKDGELVKEKAIYKRSPCIIF